MCIVLNEYYNLYYYDLDLSRPKGQISPYFQKNYHFVTPNSMSTTTVVWTTLTFHFKVQVKVKLVQSDQAIFAYWLVYLLA